MRFFRTQRELRRDLERRTIELASNSKVRSELDAEISRLELVIDKHEADEITMVARLMDLEGELLDCIEKNNELRARIHGFQGYSPGGLGDPMYEEGAGI